MKKQRTRFASVSWIVTRCLWLGPVVFTLWISLYLSKLSVDISAVVHSAEIPSSNNQIAIKPLSFLTGKRRNKAHWCMWNAHMGRPKSILEKEFGYNTTVDATKQDWDLIFGGYPHCGDPTNRRRKNKKWDWKMEYYLNKHLNKQGWETLKPHQVWFPCMGCKESYCNKRGLCEITREINPDSCYLLPNDLGRLQTRMEAEDNVGNRIWVLKRDSPTMHKHMGTNVHFILNTSQIPSAEDLADGTYLVQPFIEQHMGTGNYHRRHEVRLYIAVTSTTPLRAYAYNEPWVSLALKVYDPPSSMNTLDVCMLDTHIHRKGCTVNGLEREQLSPSFAEFCNHYNLTADQINRFQESARALIINILTTANPRIAAHPVNKGITKSQASCFSFLRVDMTITSNGEASVYEINELPFANEKGNGGRVQAQAYRDLFAMIGLDQPALPVEHRAEYELSHLGGWIPLNTPV